MKRIPTMFALMLWAVSAHAESIPYNCLTAKTGCAIIIRVPDGLPGQVLEFTYCKGECDPEYPDDPLHPGQCLKTCDLTRRSEWKTRYIYPPEGEVCNLREGIGAAQNWLDENRKGWFVARWGCTSVIRADM